MSSKTSTKNGEGKENERVLELDADDLRERLGIVAIESELESFRQLLGQVLDYMNAIDLTLQELDGEPIVTETQRYNIRKGGRIDLTKIRPAVPANLVAKQPKLSTNKASKGK